ncbi:MAG: D-amino acid aminotransferase [Thiogranum sp.]|nr:D-amino acid aminotransferase [Thiogranum sp.]
MQNTVYLNGSFLPIEDACIPVTDRGFLFGDGVYEVIPAYGGRLLRLSHHLQRLQSSLDGIRLANPLSDAAWEEVFLQLLQRNRERAGPENDQSIYLQVTRGPALKRDHSFPEHVTPTVYATANPIPAVDPEIASRGIAAVTLEDIRWQWCDIKAITLLANVLMRQRATDQDAAEALLIRDGLMIEGSSSNVFVIRDGVMQTPPKSQLMLPGITRDLVLELARTHQLPGRECDIPEAALRDADEIWITSSTREIVPVTRLNAVPVGAGVPGPLWQVMTEHYRHYKTAVRSGNAG